jgi:hypothetical protein
VEKPAGESVAVSPVPNEQVAAERVLLDSARQSLSAGRASTAMKSLNEYESRFGFGVLGHEEVVLKMRAFLALGRRAEATQLGERYLSERPSGTQAATVRRLLSAAAPANSASSPSE